MVAAIPNFADASAWDHVPEANVFDEHEDRQGEKVVRRFTQAELEKIARRCNDRDARGQLCPLTLGHTIDDEPEDKQPEIVGYARRFRVTYDNTLKRWVIRAALYLQRNRSREARTYPRLSVEYWPNKEDLYFDPIALIRRTPRRDLGQWTYGRARAGKRPVRYAMTEAAMPMPEDLDRDDDSSGSGGGDSAPPGKDPTAPPDKDSVEPEFHGKVMKCVKQGMPTLYPHLKRMHDEAAQKYGADGDAGPGEGSETDDGSGAPPAPPTPEGGGDGGGDDLPPEKMRRGGSPDRYAAVIAENKKLASKVQALERRNRHAERRAVLERYRRSGTQLDIAEEMAFAGDLPEEQWKAHQRRISRNYQKDPTAGDMVDVVHDVPDNSPEKFSKDKLSKAEEYMVAHPGCEWHEAEQYAMGKRPLHSTTNGRG